MTFRLLFQRSNLKANGMMKMLMMLISRNRGRMKMKNVFWLVEEADFRSTTELFAKKGDIKTVDNFIPKSESDFEEYAELISHKLRPYDLSLYCTTQGGNETINYFFEGGRCQRYRIFNHRDHK
ncbi:hypothetical protein V6Z11_A09G271100 [Gossypium hirsutum]